jgi:hypothetical protein
MSNRPATKYLPRRCRLLNKEVWAILTKQKRTWKIVNCLDKDRVCSKQPCAFTKDGGLWPFEYDPHIPADGG